ncbi:SdrD B-like domain-containing protein [Cellulomonas sp.]|uniref:SdrD B-like domain-containing protein n=1 Tax=Cellulomonas sp. TaxID=40001 RepID=UPI00258B5A3E|nr:SdrD B-like domain-containing protein [Cellulomonas sp.]MCR6689998.1 hypothetical protein [Cellulomonas sp.]
MVVPPTPVGTQRITGVVWLDRNRDGAQDGPGEPGLAAVPVELYRVELRGGSGVLGRVGSSGATTGRDLVARGLTEADGAFAFGSLSAGAYAIRVRYPESLAVTWDSEGQFDAEAQVVVPEHGQAQAEVGLAGDVQADLRVQTPSGSPVTGTVLLWWAGPDGVFGRDDDVRVPVEAVDGRVLAGGLPPGAYRVVGPDGSSASPPLNLSQDGDPLTVTVGTDPQTPPLAVTGWAGAALLVPAAFLIVGGLLLTRAARRRAGVHPA